MTWRVSWILSTTIEAGSEEAAFEIAAEMFPCYADDRWDGNFEVAAAKEEV